MQNKILIISTLTAGFLLLIFFIIKRIKKRKLIAKILADGESDYGVTAKNIAQSIAKSRVLYKELISKVHPDRFPNDPVKKERASEIASMLTESKRNYNKLEEISRVIENELQ
jgi:hypothetical protein